MVDVDFEIYFASETGLLIFSRVKSMSKSIF